jgi:AraC-like DNA-binding protein
MGGRTVDPVPSVAFVGPTSHAGYIAAGSGALVGVGVLPVGWAQLFGGDVSRYANRVVPLAQLDPGAGLLASALHSTDPKSAFDEWLEVRASRRPPPDPRIARLYALLHDPAITRIEAIAEELETPARVLAALARFNFGFTPKLLLRRSRFMRALSAVLSNPGESSHLLTEAGYWDRSHFLRDSHLFLGCSVREFLKRRGPLNQVAMRVREQVIGAPV